MIGVIPLVDGDGCLRPSELCWGSDGVNGVHLLLSDAALSEEFVCLGAPEDREAVISHRELSVILRGGVCQLTSHWG
jgi:hypothetical protein